MTDSTHSETNDTVLRIHHDKNFKTISCAAIDDKRLSWRAKGIHTYLITRPDNWKFYSGSIISLSQDGRDAVRSAIKELKSAGYLRITRMNANRGQLAWKWDIAEIPTYADSTIDGFTVDGPAVDGSTIDGKSPPTNKDIEQVVKKPNSTIPAGTTSSSETEYSEAFLKAMTIYPKRLGNNNKKAAFKAWRTRLKKGASTEEMVDGTERYAAFIRASGKEGTEFVLMAATFFGPNQHYLEPWTTNARSSPALVAKDNLGYGRRL